MRVWIDAQDPKSVIFLHKIAEKFRQRSIDVLFTTRAHREIPRLLEMWGIKAEIVGFHGKTLKEKLIAYARRILDFIPIVEKFKPDIAISFSSPECARTAYGLTIPHISLNDSPHAEATARLTIPLSKYLFCPWVIPKKAWIKYGIQGKNIFQYKALDVVAWIRDFKPNERVLNELGLSKDKKIIVVRALEVYAAYVLDVKKDPTIKIVRTLAREVLNAQFVILPRYEDQINKFKKEFYKEPVIIPEEPIDAQSLIYFADLLICSGGTMAQEGGLLGTPTISVFPIPYKLYCLEYLAKRKLIFKLRDLHDLVYLAKKILIKSEEFKKRLRKRAKKELSKMEDPAEFIVKTILKLFA